ncbi:MAG: DNA primase [Bacteroidales bacterium]|nr:DNA primase [Bacteroidales bacterium]
MIDQGTIEKIIDAAEIVDVIQGFVTLKKRGVNYIGLCPFHNEKTPSFTVSPSKGIFKCFGCGKGGNAVTFLMEQEHLSYYESLKYLANKYNIEVEERELTADEIQHRNERESLLIVTSFAQKYFTDILYNNNEGKAIGLSYFQERGFEEKTIEKFQLGFCLSEKDGFTRSAISKNYKLDFLIKSGLTIKSGERTFDRFNDRVIFPIHNLMGKVIGFGGRILKEDKKIAKYLNSPESDIYHKSKIVYGIFFAKNSIVKNDKCYLVEGYTDVLSLHQSKIENVVASSGTSLTTDQIRLIKRFTNNITVIYDGDEAGIKASLRGIDIILEEGMNVRVLLLPEGEDPDSFAKKHSAFEVNEFIVKNEKDFISFKTQILLDDAKSDPVKRANLITEIIRSVAVIPDKIIQSEYIKECSTLLSTSEQILYSQLNKIRFKNSEALKRKQALQTDMFSQKTQPPIPSYVEDIYCEPEEKEIIRLLLNYGNLNLFTEEDENKKEYFTSVSEYIIKEILNDDLQFKNLTYKQIFKDYHQHLLKAKPISEKYFINHSNEEICKLAANLLGPKYGLSKIWEQHGSYVETEEMKLKEIVPKSIISFKSRIIQKAIKETQENIRTAQKDNTTDKIEEYQQKLISLNNIKMLLSKNLGQRTII